VAKPGVRTSYRTGLLITLRLANFESDYVRSNTARMNVTEKWRGVERYQWGEKGD
jgi:hypothetical protein